MRKGNSLTTALICFSNATNSISQHIAHFLVWWSLHRCVVCLEFTNVLFWHVFVIVRISSSGLFWSSSYILCFTYLFPVAPFYPHEVLLCVCFIMSKPFSSPCFCLGYGLWLWTCIWLHCLSVSWPPLCFLDLYPISNHTSHHIQLLVTNSNKMSLHGVGHHI